MITWKNKDLVKISWNKTKENLWPVVGLMVVIYIASSLAREINLGFIVDILASFVLTSVFLRIAKGEKFDFKKIFDDISGSKFLHYFLAIFISTIFVLVGVAFLVVPGIIIALMLLFVGYILVEENKEMHWKSWKFWEAIKQSHFLTKGYKWRIFLFILVLAGINILGFLAFLVGLFITIPLSGIAMASLYEKFKEKQRSFGAGNNPSASSSEQVS